MPKSKPRTNKPSKKPIAQYEHADKTRKNNPPVGLVTPETDRDGGKKRYAYDPHLDPQLVWAGKAEHTSFEIPTVSLHVHERIDPRTIVEAVRKRNGNGQFAQLPLFESPVENPPLRHAGLARLRMWSSGVDVGLCVIPRVYRLLSPNSA